MPSNELTVLLKLKDKATKQFKTAQGAVKRFALNVNNLTKKMVNLRSVITIGAIVGITRNFIRAASSVEVFAKQLEIVTKDANEAALALDAIREFARTSPLETEDVVQSYVRLRAVGINPTIEQMRTLGGVAVLMNRQMTDVLQAFIGMNKRTLRELGIDIDRTGQKAVIQSGNVRKVVEKDSASIRKALIEIWEERFPNAIEAAADTTKAKVAIMKSEIFELSAAVGDRLKPAFDKVVGVIGRLASKMRAAFDPTTAEAMAELRAEAVKLEKQLETGFSDEFVSGRLGRRSDIVDKRIANAQKRLVEIDALMFELQKKLDGETGLPGTGQLGTSPVGGAGESSKVKAIDRLKEFAKESERLMKEELARREEETRGQEAMWNARGERIQIAMEEDKALTDEAVRNAEERMRIALAEHNMKQDIVRGFGRLTQQTINLIGEATQAEGEAARKLQIIGAGLALVEGAVAGAMAIKTAWSSSSTWQEGLAVSIATAAEVAALTASLVSSINSQSFANGGIVSGNSTSGDRIAVGVNSQEMILNKSQQAELFRMANGEASNTTNNNMGGITFVLQGDQVNDLQNALRDGRLSDFVVDFSRKQKSMAVI